MDDEPLLRMTLSDFISESGFEVLEAQDAEEASQILQANDDVAALVTDVRMPGNKDGFALAREVAASSRDIRIFVMSGYVGEADTHLPEGAAFLSKPFSHASLVGMLTAALRT